MSDTVLDTEDDTTVSQTNKNLFLHTTRLLVGKTDYKQIM